MPVPARLHGRQLRVHHQPVRAEPLPERRPVQSERRPETRLHLPARLHRRLLPDRHRQLRQRTVPQRRHLPLSPLHLQLQLRARLPRPKLPVRPQSLLLQPLLLQRLLPGPGRQRFRLQVIIKLLINSDINYVLISVFSYLFVNKTIEDKSESEAL